MDTTVKKDVKESWTPSDLVVTKTEWLLTRLCNSHCSYCKIRDNRSLVGPEMSTGLVEMGLELINRYWPGSPVVLYGGEPTVRGDLPQIVKHGVSLGMKIVVISNSYFMASDPDLLKRLVDSGLDNWSVSLDGFKGNTFIDRFVEKRARYALQSLSLAYHLGIRDRVACITVSKYNIRSLDHIITELTKKGVWSICTPLQIACSGYEYSKGKYSDLPSQRDLELVTPDLVGMAKSGSYLMHNGADWFELWPEYFRSQTLMCHDKSCFTVDADGHLRYCIDIPLRQEDRTTLFELEIREGFDRYVNALKKPRPCEGCFWDPVFETTHLAQIDEIAARKWFRHELSAEQKSKLLPQALEYL